MSRFAEFVSGAGWKDRDILRCSARIEAHTPEDKELLRRRARHRRENPGKPYGDITKPRSGRGISAEQLRQARAGKVLPPQVRAKLVRVVNELLARQGRGPVEATRLFGLAAVEPANSADANASAPSPTPAALQGGDTAAAAL